MEPRFWHTSLADLSWASYFYSREVEDLVEARAGNRPPVSTRASIWRRNSSPHRLFSCSHMSSGRQPAPLVKGERGARRQFVFRVSLAVAYGHLQGNLRLPVLRGHAVLHRECTAYALVTWHLQVAFADRLFEATWCTLTSALGCRTHPGGTWSLNALASYSFGSFSTWWTANVPTSTSTPTPSSSEGSEEWLCKPSTVETQVRCSV